VTVPVAGSRTQTQHRGPRRRYNGVSSCQPPPVTNWTGEFMSSLIAEVGLHRQRLRHLLATTRGVVRIASAYVTESEMLGEAGDREIRLLTTLTPMDFVSGATSPDALKVLMDEGVDCRFVAHDPRLHAKVYIFGNEVALVTSANLTRSAMDSNIEVGAFVDRSEVHALIRWFDQQWNSATHLGASTLDEWNRLTAAPRVEYSDWQDRVRHLIIPPPPSGGPGVPLPSASFFRCNSNRKEARRHGYDDRYLELLMKKERFAAAWSEFAYPGHMQRVHECDIIFLFASGNVGIIAIGRATARYEVIVHNEGGQIFEGFEADEWRVPVEWLVWVEDQNAYRWTSNLPPAFLDISNTLYKSDREAAWQHLLGDH